MKTSAQYYAQQLPGLGDRFLKEIGSGVSAIRDYPESGVIIYPGLRRKLSGISPMPCCIASRQPRLSFLPSCTCTVSLATG